MDHNTHNQDLYLLNCNIVHDFLLTLLLSIVLCRETLLAFVGSCAH